MGTSHIRRHGRPRHPIKIQPIYARYWKTIIFNGLIVLQCSYAQDDIHTMNIETRGSWGMVLYGTILYFDRASTDQLGV